MPKYQITAEFGLASEIEPSGVRFGGNADDFQDNSYFGISEVTSDGGAVEFTVEAEDEDRAREISEEEIYDGMEVEDDNGFTWVVTDLNVEVEAVRWEPTVEEARGVLEDFATNHLDSSDELLQRTAIAAETVLQDYDRMRNRITSLEARVEEADSRIAGLSTRLQETEDRISQLCSREAEPTTPTA